MKPFGWVSGLVVLLCVVGLVPGLVLGAERPLRFGQSGQFKILQVSDMHIGIDGLLPCLNILRSQRPCSSLNTTAFLQRVIAAEQPDFIVFSGDNIFGYAAFWDTHRFMDEAFAPAIETNIPWAAFLGNHDQEPFQFTRKNLMNYIAGLKNTLSQVNPPDAPDIHGSGNYILEVGGIQGSSFEDKSVLNLYFLDSGDYVSPLPFPPYDYIRESQQSWFRSTSERLKEEYTSAPNPQVGPAPGLVYFHIPLPEFDKAEIITGDKQESVSSPEYNSGFFDTIVEAGDAKAVFVGHDHVNDFCGKLSGLQLCYAGGFGYQTYGKAGWPRRARVVLASLEKTTTGYGAVESITTWKRLDDEHLSTKDHQVIWTKSKAAEAPLRKKRVSRLRKMINTGLLTEMI